VIDQKLLENDHQTTNQWVLTHLLLYTAGHTDTDRHIQTTRADLRYLDNALAAATTAKFRDVMELAKICFHQIRIRHTTTTCSVKLRYNYMEKKSHTVDVCIY